MQPIRSNVTKLDGAARTGTNDLSIVPAANRHHDAGDDGSANVSLSRKGYLRVVMQVISCSGRLNEAERKKLLSTELLYGVGNAGVYGMCLYEKWLRDGVQDVIQVSAFCGNELPEMWITVAHELAHVLAGRGTAHGPIWKATAQKLGLRNPKATGAGSINDLEADLVTVLQAIPLPTDGEPICDDPVAGGKPVHKGCTLGIGSLGGKSRGPGSGRMRLWLCECPKPYRVRIATDHFRARCLNCGALFKRDGAVAEPRSELTMAVGV